jgi:hypothetical protein
VCRRASLRCGSHSCASWVTSLSHVFSFCFLSLFP